MDGIGLDRGEVVIQADVSKLGWLLSVTALPAGHPWLGRPPEPPQPPTAEATTAS